MGKGKEPNTENKLKHTNLKAFQVNCMTTQNGEKIK